MKIVHKIETELYDNDGILTGGEEFLRRYPAQRYGKTTTFVFSEEGMLAEALSLLAKYGLKAERFYVFELDPNEVATYPAIYLGIYITYDLLIDNRVNEMQLNQAGIAMDYQSERIVVTPRVKKLLEGMTRGLQWESTEGTDRRAFVLMKVVEQLPEPIVVPSPVYLGLNERPPGTYAVRSDGRDVITNANISKLVEVGLAVSEEVETQSKVLRWRPRLVASGAVIHALQSASIKGLLEPISPLIPESHPLAHKNKNASRQGDR